MTILLYISVVGVILTGLIFYRLIAAIHRSRHLEARVAAESAERHAAERQVQHMEKMASLGKLSATVAHELNNPISGMLTYARLVERELLEQPLDAAVLQELQRYLQLVQRECVRCGGIVQNLLVFARKTDTQFAPVDLNDIVERSLMLVRHHMEMRGLVAETTLLDGDTTITADAGELEQALVALFVNAIEAMERGGMLRVRLHAQGDDVFIDIADTGVGIPADVQPLIFEPFYSTKQESGSGLGLAVVYGIVHRHRGSIRLESAPGQGATFYLQLPRDPSVRERLAVALGAQP